MNRNRILSDYLGFGPSDLPFVDPDPGFLERARVPHGGTRRVSTQLPSPRAVTRADSSAPAANGSRFRRLCLDRHVLYQVGPVQRRKLPDLFLRIRVCVARVG